MPLPFASSLILELWLVMFGWSATLSDLMAHKWL